MELMTAIIFIKDRNYPIKYRKISNINKFVIFAQSKYPFATAINFYKKETKEFLKQIKI
jgi:hypothetical protein